MSGRNLNWDRAAKRDLVKLRGGLDHRKKPKRERGPTGKQQKYLAALARQLGRKYPQPETSQDASFLIDEYKAELGMGVSFNTTRR